MEIKVLDQEKNSVRLELVGVNNTMSNILSKALWNNSDVDVVGYNQKHPETTNPILILSTKKNNPKKAILETLAVLKKENKDFISQFNKIVK